MEVITFENIEKLNIFAAEKFVEIAKDSIAEHGCFTVALSGGSTPKKLYSLLTQEPFRSQVEWNKVYFFFGDERNVSIDSEESNFRMANENLFEPLQIPKSNSFRWKDTNVIQWHAGSEDVEKIAEEYETAIYIFFGLDEEKRIPQFDLILLGMGTDGHTASLFPCTEALHETGRIAVENWVEKLNSWRFTLTFPTINNARNVIFLISGQEKAETLKEVLHGEFQPEKLPAQSVKPTDGELLFLTDIVL